MVNIFAFGSDALVVMPVLFMNFVLVSVSMALFLRVNTNRTLMYFGILYACMTLALVYLIDDSGWLPAFIVLAIHPILFAALHIRIVRDVDSKTKKRKLSTLRNMVFAGSATLIIFLSIFAIGSA